MESEDRATRAIQRLTEWLGEEPDFLDGVLGALREGGGGIR